MSTEKILNKINALQKKKEDKIIRYIFPLEAKIEELRREYLKNPEKAKQAV